MKPATLVLTALIALPLLAGGAEAQIPVPGVAIQDADQPRPGRGWKKVESPHFAIIYPSGMQAEAQRVARTLEQLRDPLGHTMGKAPRRLTVVLQAETATSNAYAALAPRRAVWITTPPAFGSLLGTGDWLTLLATHETRHITQMDRTDVGTTRIGRLFFGDLGWLLLSHVAIPGWMWEGDAVVTETAMSLTGRGREPEFTQEIRALALADRLPGYYEAMLGSYRDFFPNEYPLGYLMTSYMRRHMGDSSVSRLFRNAAAQSINPFSFHVAAKSLLHVTPPQLYEMAMQEAESTWHARLDSVTTTPATRRTPETTEYTAFEFPQAMADGSIIALRHGFGDLRKIVRIADSGVVSLADAPTYGAIRAGGDLVAWTETLPDVRWGWHEETLIRVLDTRTRDVRTLGEPGRWAFPAPSPDGRRLAAVSLSRTRGSSIVLLDAVTGTRLDSIAVPDDEHAMDLSWRPDGGALVFTRHRSPERTTSFPSIPQAGRGIASHRGRSELVRRACLGTGGRCCSARQLSAARRSSR